MTIWERLYDVVAQSLPTLAVIAALALVLLALQFFLQKTLFRYTGLSLQATPQINKEAEQEYQD